MEAFVTEAFTLLGVGLLFIGLRSYVRISTVGWKGLQADDYLMWVAAVCYSFYQQPDTPTNRLLRIDCLFCRDRVSILRWGVLEGISQQWNDRRAASGAGSKQ